MRIRHEQKVAKYGLITDRNNLQFAPAVFSQTGQIYGSFKSLIKEQIRRRLIDFEGQAKPTKIKSVMKWWSKRISMMIAKTASRSVAFKSVKLAESAFTSQADVLTRQVATKGLSSNDSETDFQHLGHNADLHIFNQRRLSKRIDHVIIA